MASHQERGEKSATPDSRRPLDDRAEEEVAEQPKASSFRRTLTVVGHYILLGLAPVISVIALIVAVLAVTGNHSGEEQLSKAIAKIDNLTANLAASKSELDRLKVVIAHEKSVQEEERKKQDEQLAKIIQNVTPMQVKLKISPTLEDQLRQAVSVSGVLPAAALAAPATSAATTVPAASDKKLSPQVQAMKAAIDKYNKK